MWQRQSILDRTEDKKMFQGVEISSELNKAFSKEKIDMNEQDT
jgi:hypothetical protein